MDLKDSARPQATKIYEAYPKITITVYLRNK